MGSELTILLKLQKLRPSSIPFLPRGYESKTKLFILRPMYNEAPTLREFMLETENDVACVMNEVAKALQFCHKRAVCVVDLRPESIVIKDKDKLKVEITDFTMAVDANYELTKEDDLRMKNGTLGYVAPEFLSNTPMKKRCLIFKR